MTLFLTHVPKTAGTSMREAVFDHGILESRVRSFSGLRRAFIDQVDFDLLTGHYPYGVHNLYSSTDSRYFVMLRDPVDRAISQYYFTKMGDKPWYSHPNLEEVKKNDLVGFYQNPAHQNMQARYVAGLVWEWIGRHVSLNGVFRGTVLGRAKQHLLEEYEAFGLKERFEESAHIFANELETTPRFPGQRRKKTKNRPSKDDLADETRRRLRVLNSLDVALYDFAYDHFEMQKGDAVSDEITD
jgi:hypothetical protein